MSIKNRLYKLEKQDSSSAPSWAEFITGAWQPTPQAWQAFLLKSEISYQVQDESGVITVRFFDGRKDQVKELLPGVKTYCGFDPSLWDGVQ
jgi:hypothetical protein